MHVSLLCFISDIEELLQDLKADDVPEPVGDLQELESMINERYIYN